MRKFERLLSTIVSFVGDQFSKILYVSRKIGKKIGNREECSSDGVRNFLRRHYANAKMPAIKVEGKGWHPTTTMYVIGRKIFHRGRIVCKVRYRYSLS